MAATPQKLTGSLVGTRGWDVSSAGKTRLHPSESMREEQDAGTHRSSTCLDHSSILWEGGRAPRRNSNGLARVTRPPAATSNHLDIPSRGLIAPPAASREAGRGKPSLRSPTPTLLYDHACMLLFDLSSRHRSHSGTGAPILANSVICT